MDIERALSAIGDWFEGDAHRVVEITEQAPDNTSAWPQSRDFISVRGEHRGNSADRDDVTGEVYFEFKPGRFIKTEYWA